MKILLTAHQFLPEFSAGTEILTYETAKELKTRGHAVEVWAGFPADPALAMEHPVASYEYEGVTVHRYNHSLQAHDGNIVEFEYNNHSFARHFREYIKKASPDVVHFFHFARLSASPVDVCRESGIPMFFTPTDFWVICPTCQLRLADNSLCGGPDRLGVNCLRHHISVESASLPSRYEKIKKLARRFPDRFFSFMISWSVKAWWPERRFSPFLRAVAERKNFMIERLNHLDGVLVPSRFMEKMLVQNGADGRNFHFLPYGLNLTLFNGQKGRKRDKKLRVGFIGTLIEHKGAHVLLEAVRHLPKEMPLEVKIYGKLNEIPDYTAKLWKLAEGDGRTEFCGQFPNDSIGEVFSGLDVLVVPSIWFENTPLIIYSAHAAGVPVIGSNLGGISEVVHHEKNGLLFEKGDCAALGKLLKRVFEERTLLESLAKNLVFPQSISGYVDGLEEVYRDVLAKRRKNI